MNRGFSLLELLMVFAILAILSSLAIVSYRRTRGANRLDGFTDQVSTVVMMTRRRALATSTDFIVHLLPNSVAYCQLDPANPSQSSCPTPANANCAPFGAGTAPCESVRAMTSGSSASIVQWANQPDDLGQSGIVRQPIGSGRVLRCYGTGRFAGACDSDPATPNPDGFTVYLASSDESSRHRKVVVYPAAGRPRVIDSW